MLADLRIMDTHVCHKQCAKCKRYGHWKKDRTPALQLRHSKCYNCGRFGHFHSRCTNRQVFQQGWSLLERAPPEPPIPPNPPAPPPPPPQGERRVIGFILHPPLLPQHIDYSDPLQDEEPEEPEAPAPDFNALLDETFAQEDAMRPLHSNMTIIDEAGFPLYQLPVLSRGDRNLIMRMRSCTFCALQHPGNVANCPFIFMQRHLDV
jgi:hypothetical protein